MLREKNASKIAVKAKTRAPTKNYVISVIAFLCVVIGQGHDTSHAGIKTRS